MKASSAAVRLGASCSRDRAIERFTRGLSYTTIYADSERLLYHRYSCRRYSTLVICIGDGESLGKCSLDWLCHAQRSSPAVWLSTPSACPNPAERPTCRSCHSHG